MLARINFFIPFLIVASLFHFSCNSQPPSNTLADSTSKKAEKELIETILKSYPKKFSQIISNEKEYEVQIIYTQVNRSQNNSPSFKQFDFHLDPKKYFYSASLVKLPCAVLALEKLNTLAIKGLDKNSVMQTNSAWKCQKTIRKDSSSENGLPSIANYIKKMLLVSDNDSYSRIYEFLGQQYIHDKLSEKGYNNIRIIHRFDAECAGEQNSYTNPISFYDQEGNLLYKQPLQHCSAKYENPIGMVKKGVGYVDNQERYVYEPKDFTHYNYMCLQDINNILRSIIFPNSVDEKGRFNLSSDDYDFLYKYISMYPSESDHPKYSSKEYKDSYKKYFVYGTQKNKINNDTLRIFNVVGQSYGYLSDCAYICDFRNNIEFMLSAVIYVNKDGIINDGKYDYDEVGFPFLSDLGNVIYEYEFNRKKEYSPDLAKFKIVYK